jgi:hypothetical protein
MASLVVNIKTPIPIETTKTAAVRTFVLNSKEYKTLKKRSIRKLKNLQNQLDLAKLAAKVGQNQLSSSKTKLANLKEEIKTNKIKSDNLEAEKKVWTSYRKKLESHIDKLEITQSRLRQEKILMGTISKSRANNMKKKLEQSNDVIKYLRETIVTINLHIQAMNIITNALKMNKYIK